MSYLVLPHGLAPKQHHEISAEEMAWLAMAEDVLHKLGATITCLRCKTPFHGRNDPTDATIRVDCTCRTLSYRVRAEQP